MEDIQKKYRVSGHAELDSIVAKPVIKIIVINRYRLKEACNRKGITIAELAKLSLNWSPPTIYNRLNNGFNIADATSVAECLDVELNKLTEFV